MSSSKKDYSTAAKVYVAAILAYPIGFISTHTGPGRGSAPAAVRLHVGVGGIVDSYSLTSWYRSGIQPWCWTPSLIILLRKCKRERVAEGSSAPGVGKPQTTVHQFVPQLSELCLQPEPALVPKDMSSSHPCMSVKLVVLH